MGRRFWVQFQKGPLWGGGVVSVSSCDGLAGSPECIPPPPTVGLAAARIRGPDLQKTDGTGARLKETSIKLVFWGVEL